MIARASVFAAIALLAMDLAPPASGQDRETRIRPVTSDGQSLAEQDRPEWFNELVAAIDAQLPPDLRSAAKELLESHYHNLRDRLRQRWRDEPDELVRWFQRSSEAAHAKDAFVRLLRSGGALLSDDEALPELVERAKPGVAVVIAFDREGQEIASGTGFYVDAGLLLTNRHVIEGASSLKIREHDGRTLDDVLVVADSARADVVLLSLLHDETRRVLPLGSELPRPGEEVLVLGNPFGLEHTLSAGIVSAVRAVRGSGVLVQMTASISEGSSGSPVFDAEGRVIAIATSTVKEGEGLHFAVPVTRLTELIDRRWLVRTPEEWYESVYAGQQGRIALYYRNHYLLRRMSQEARAAFRARKWDRELGDEPVLGEDDTHLLNQAVAYYERAARARPKDDHLWFALAECAVDAGKFAVGLEAIRNAIDLRPAPKTLDQLRADPMLGDDVEEYLLFRHDLEVIAIADRYHLLARCLVGDATQRTADAVHRRPAGDAGRVVERFEGEFVRARDSAIVAARQGLEYAGAVREDRISKDTLCGLHITLANLLVASDKPGEALAEAQAALKFGESRSAYAVMANAHEKLGDTSREIDCRERVIELNPQGWWDFRLLGEAYLRAGNRSGAQGIARRLREAGDPEAGMWAEWLQSQIEGR